MKVHPGDIVRIKCFTKRPNHWNSMGDMDDMMGRQVKIKSVTTFSVHLDDIHNRWLWMESDFEPIKEHSKIDFEIEELFEI